MKCKQYEVFANREKVGELAARCLSQAKKDAWYKMGSKLKGVVEVKQRKE